MSPEACLAIPSSAWHPNPNIANMVSLPKADRELENRTRPLGFQSQEDLDHCVFERPCQVSGRCHAKTFFSESSPWYQRVMILSWI